jgi:hypothetical protein
MHLVVDHPRQQPGACGVDDRGAGLSADGAVDAGDAPVANQQVAVADSPSFTRRAFLIRSVLDMAADYRP